MPLALFGETLPQGLEQLIEATQGLQPLAILLRQPPLQLQPQPIRGKRLRIRRTLRPGQLAGIDLVETVEEALVLDQHGARQQIKGLGIGHRQAGIQGSVQIQQFAQGHRDARGPESSEEIEEHAALSSAAGA